jgi:transcriptional regulator with XRE-family HTH domain
MGGRVRHARKLANLTQETLAKACSVTRVAVARWETDVSAPEKHYLQIADACGVNLDWLMKGKGEPRKVGYVDLVQKVPAASKALKKMIGEVIDEKLGSLQQAVRRPLDAIIAKMGRVSNRAFPLMGQAMAKDDQDSRNYEFSAIEPGAVQLTSSSDPRAVCVRGQSGEELARDGQFVIVDATVTNVDIGEPCVILTQDGLGRLKRKARDRDEKRCYGSINAAYPDFVVPPRQVLAELPVVGICLKPGACKTDFETVDEGPPPKTA